MGIGKFLDFVIFGCFDFFLLESIGYCGTSRFCSVLLISCVFHVWPMVLCLNGGFIVLLKFWLSSMVVGLIG
jgi:hypothetical protein